MEDKVRNHDKHTASRIHAMHRRQAPDGEIELNIRFSEIEDHERYLQLEDTCCYGTVVNKYWASSKGINVLLCEILCCII